MKNNLKKYTSKLEKINNIPTLVCIALVLVAISVLLLVQGPSDTSSNTILKKISLNLPEIRSKTIIPVKNEDAEDPNSLSHNVALFDVNSGTMLYGRNEDQAVPIASITKIMTALVVADYYKLEDTVVVSDSASKSIGSTMNLKSEEKITINNVLYGLLLNSGNDAAIALAENFYKYSPTATEETSYQDFINEMNKKAKELHLEKTNYKDPAGLDDEGLSSAREQGIIVAAALKNPVLRKVISTPEITVSSEDGKITHNLTNSNRLVKEEMHYDGIIGGKTGFTPVAGHNLVAAAERDGQILVAVIINTYEKTKIASAVEAKKLLDWGFGNFKWEEI